MEDIKKEKRSYDPKTPLKKADDWTRRTFIRRAGTFMAAFGVPWLVRIETMEKLSKRVFGSSVAFAQSGGPSRFLIAVGSRAGYPLNNVFPVRQDVEGSLIANRNVHFAPSGDGGTGQVVATASGPGLALAPQNAALLGPFADRIAMMTGFRNLNGHTNMHSSNAMPGGTDFLVAHAHAMSTVAAATLSQPIVFGSQDAVDRSMLGSVSAAFAPTYVQSIDEVVSMFSPFQLNAPTGEMGTEITGQIFDVIQSDLNQPILDALATRPGGDVVDAGMQKLKALLSQNLAAELDLNSTANQARVTAMGAGVTEPNNMFNMVDDSVDLMVMAGLLFSLGVVNEICIVQNTGDWHGRHATPVTANDGNATTQGEHAAFWGNLLANMLTEYETNDPSKYIGLDGNPIGVDVVFTSEFGRTANDDGDNGDGDHQDLCIISPNVNGSTYGNLDTSLEWLQPNVNTGADGSRGQLGQSYQVSTVYRALGLDPTEYGISSTDANAYLKAAIKS